MPYTIISRILIYYFKITK